MGEYIFSGSGLPFGSSVSYSYKWKVVGSGDVTADDIAIYLSDHTDPGWPEEWAYRTDYMVGVNADMQLFFSNDGGETYTEITGVTNVTYDGNTYPVKLQGMNTCYGPSAPSLTSDITLYHFDPLHPSITTMQNNIGGMLNGYAQDIMTYEEWAKHQAGVKCCHWTMYKDGATYYLTWDSPFIEYAEGEYNDVLPEMVNVKYYYTWDPGTGGVRSNTFSIAYTNEPLQFNMQTIMEKSIPNKFLQAVAKSVDIFQWISPTDFLQINFQLEWSDADGVDHTDDCYVRFDSNTIAWFFNGNQKNKTITETVLNYTVASADGSTVTLKDGYFADDPDYKGPGDGTDNGYTDPTVPSDTLGTTTAYGNNNILTTSYAMTAPRLASLGAYLWGGLFESTIQKINSSPLENIVSLRCYPFDLSGIDQEIYLGNAGTGVQGAKIADNYNATFSVGSVTIEGFYDSFLDYEPYTSLKIFLPFCGMKDLDLNYCMGKTISVEYVVDIGTGTGSINIYVDTVLTYTYSCNIGFEIPLSSTNSGQVAGSLMSNAASTAVAVAVEAASENYLAMAGTLVTAGIKAATTKHTTSTSGNFSANVWGRMPRTCYIVYDRPTYQNIAMFNHTYGRMCNQSRVIGSLSGFTMITNLDLSGIAIMTKEEEDIIRELFRDGIYV